MVSQLLSDLIIRVAFHYFYNFHPTLIGVEVTQGHGTVEVILEYRLLYVAYYDTHPQ